MCALESELTQKGSGWFGVVPTTLKRPKSLVHRIREAPAWYRDAPEQRRPLDGITALCRFCCGPTNEYRRF